MYLFLENCQFIAVLFSIQSNTCIYIKLYTYRPLKDTQNRIKPCFNVNISIDFFKDKSDGTTQGHLEYLGRGRTVHVSG